ncbi:DNA helicase RecQ [Wenxinia marina]|uniref:DNA helicase RecQ n=1 Tax=Wenxinia marina DSM 24838 TaxID=1123501 RepID=A0A0D0PHF5_9RHOB|nr:DNA helicase RecQ [Wenxinia marina]KIQ70776.1 ATP-dependent DNA helicase RecQ [Wenxinia marina DSM 24838]GGL80241.1 ATP-dependent DNA helicase RecQ [Wenxinia marina]
MNAVPLLREVFGFDGFRPGQDEVVEAVAGGRDVLAIMPTGGGKSLCFQLPALMRDGVTVVISPLIALMRDQVRGLREAGVEAGALTSGNTPEETDAVWDAANEGRLKLLYMAPERLAVGGVVQALKRIGVTALAVDEAHCVSQWGHDFRPDYLRIGELRRTLDVPLAAFTATADAETRVEIVEKLFAGHEPAMFLRGFDRPNIHLAFAVKDRPREQILAFAGARKGQSGIVYCGTRAKTETLARALSEAGHEAISYHGGMEAEARRDAETRFQREDGLIVCATIAFGMGIDKPDIRWVAHADLPKSIESYYQEIGRAGRDGAPAETLTLYGQDDIRYRRSQIDEGLAPPERRMADHGRLNALLGLAESLGCRRRGLLAYFGETAPGDCGNCDLCDTPPETFDATTPVRMALSAALRTGESFGAGHLIDVLTGTLTDKVRQRGHDGLPTFGVGREWDKRQWQGIFRQMLGLDLMRPDPERHGGLRMTDRARPILKGEEEVTLRRDTMQLRAQPRVQAMVSDEDAPLLSALKAKRRFLAEAQGVPAYIVFNDRTLIEMAERRPTTLDEMARIGGVGAKKLDSYGRAFLEVITGAAAEVHPARMRLAGRPEGAVFDRLHEAQLRLARGPDGTGKPLNCTSATLRHIAEGRPGDIAALERIPGMGPQKAERFGDAFLEVLKDT